MYAIATQTVTGTSAATITFSNIPQNFQHLQLRATCKTTRDYGGNNDDWFIVSIPGVTPGYNHYLSTNGSSSLTGTAGQNGYLGTVISSAPFLVNNSYLYSPVVMDVFDYTNTNKYKTFTSLFGMDPNSTTYPNGPAVGIASAVYPTTNAVTSIVISNFVAWAVGSTFTLYGIPSSTTTGA